MGKALQRIQSRYRGTLLGAAIADALAFPLRNYSRNFLLSVAQPLTREYQSPPDGFHPRGQTTDDTQGWIAVIDAVLEQGGFEPDASSARLVVDHLIPLWRDLRVIDGDPDTTEVMQRIVRGITVWNGAALPPGRATAGAVTRAIPLGLWDCRSAEEIPSHVETVVRVTHEDPRVLAVAAGVAAAIATNVCAEELILGQLLDAVAGASSRFDAGVAEAVLDMPRFLSQTDRRALEMILDARADLAYPPPDDGLGDYVVPVLLLALYEFLKEPQDYEKAVDRSLRLGGQLSTVAALTGALSGSFIGAANLPRRLVADLLENDAIQSRADQLYELRRRVLRASREAAEGEGEHQAADAEEAAVDDAEEIV
jgi:ADP-ribosylglycohydrolase